MQEQHGSVSSLTGTGSVNVCEEGAGIEGDETGIICEGFTVTTTGGAIGAEPRILSGIFACARTRRRSRGTFSCGVGSGKSAPFATARASRQAPARFPPPAIDCSALPIHRSPKASQMVPSATSSRRAEITGIVSGCSR